MSPALSLHERIVVITGASGGIGAALAVAVSREGAVPVLVARRADALAEVAARCATHAVCLEADVTVRAEVERVAREAVTRAGRVDAWVSNVGRGITRAPTALTDDDLDEMLRVNVKSVLYGAQAILPHFRERGEGHLVHVSSTLGRIPSVVFRSAYSAAKHFLNALTADLRTELGASDPGIAVSLVSPGVVRTAFGANARHGGPDSRTLPNSQSAEEVADVIVDVLRTRRPDVYTRAGARQRVLDYMAALGEDP